MFGFAADKVDKISDFRLANIARRGLALENMIHHIDKPFELLTFFRHFGGI